MHIKKSKV